MPIKMAVRIDWYVGIWKVAVEKVIGVEFKTHPYSKLPTFAKSIHSAYTITLMVHVRNVRHIDVNYQ